MKIIDLREEHTSSYFKCLEDWSDEMDDAGDRKAMWFEKMSGRGLRVKLAVDDGGNVGGMIQYLPVEHSFIDGRDCYFINCIWVHGYTQGRGNFQGNGMGGALLEAAEADARTMGACGIAAWGLSLPFWMKASWFKKHGYKKADREGMRMLVWKPFVTHAVPPRWIRQKKEPLPRPGKVVVTALVNGWCPAMNMTFERAKRAAREYGDCVEFIEIDTTDRSVFLEWGIADGIFIDGKQLRFGPPLSYEKIKKLIGKRVDRLTS